MAKTARRLLALYPRAWRERYGDEFLELVGDEPLSVTQVINIVSGAIDARVSPGVRASTAKRNGALVPQGATTTMTLLKSICVHDKRAPFSRRDSLIGAAVLIVTTFVLAFGGVYLRRHGWPDLGEYLKGVAFPVSLVASMPFTWMKGQSLAAQVVIIGGTLSIIAALGWVSMLI
jgi:hypothetical protein